MPQKTAKKSARRPQPTVSPRVALEQVSQKAGRASAAPAASGQKKMARTSARQRSRARTTAVQQAGGVLERSHARSMPGSAQLVLSPCAEAMAFYERAFGAKEALRVPGPDGLPVRVEIEVGGSLLMLCDPAQVPAPDGARRESTAGTTPRLTLYVKDVDATFQRAVQAGATVTMPPQDQFWGERFGQVQDPYGYVWSIATHLRAVTPEELRAALARMHAAEA